MKKYVTLLTAALCLMFIFSLSAKADDQSVSDYKTDAIEAIKNADTPEKLDQALEDAKTAIETIKSITNPTQQDDEDAALIVKAIIEKLPIEIDTFDTVIQKVWSTLTDQQKAVVSNELLKILDKADKRVQRIKSLYEALSKNQQGLISAEVEKILGRIQTRINNLKEKVKQAAATDSATDNTSTKTDTTSNKQQTSTSNKQTTTPAQQAASQPATADVAVGSIQTVGNSKYLVTSANTVTYGKPVSKTVKALAIPSKVMIKGKAYTVTAIYRKAFAGCKKLKAVFIPSTVRKIGSKAFFKCKNLKQIYIKTSLLTKATVGKAAFKKVHKKAKFYVPKAKKKAYKKILKKRGMTAGMKVK